jgi:hypothetical protein
MQNGRTGVWRTRMMLKSIPEFGLEILMEIGKAVEYVHLLGSQIGLILSVYYFDK